MLRQSNSYNIRTLIRFLLIPEILEAETKIEGLLDADQTNGDQTNDDQTNGDQTNDDSSNGDSGTVAKRWFPEERQLKDTSQLLKLAEQTGFYVPDHLIPPQERN